jgi:hypothetical protein
VFLTRLIWARGLWDKPEAHFEGDRLTRADVLGLALKGLWTAERAEAWAERRGFVPFTERPDPASYDPQEELNWTLPMALIWIATHDINEVREAWPEWLNSHKVWGSFELSGKTCWNLVPRSRDGLQHDCRSSASRRSSGREESARRRSPSRSRNDRIGSPDNATERSGQLALLRF